MIKVHILGTEATLYKRKWSSRNQKISEALNLWTEELYHLHHDIDIAKEAIKLWNGQIISSPDIRQIS